MRFTFSTRWSQNLAEFYFQDNQEVMSVSSVAMSRTKGSKRPWRRKSSGNVRLRHRGGIATQTPESDGGTHDHDPLIPPLDVWQKPAKRGSGGGSLIPWEWCKCSSP